MQEGRVYERLEALERTTERHGTLLMELTRRMEAVEDMRSDLTAWSRPSSGWRGV